MNTVSLEIAALQATYDAGETPASVLTRVLDRIEAGGLNPVWISLVPREWVLARAEQIARGDRKTMPLYGVPFAVKDNIDVQGMDTTAACPAFRYRAEESAAVVQKLEDAGAILVGKTNMDQFATGLVGTRTPYGACASVFNADYISGGSSSGSAVAVASGLVCFALGTDTAGSGRVPAAFNNLIGLKPTRGALSTRGVLPACRSLDCVSIFALTASDAAKVFESAHGFDAADPYSRPFTDVPSPWLGGVFRFGVPLRSQQEFFGDAEAGWLYDQAIEALKKVGGIAVEFDLTPFLEAAQLLYAGPWVSERLAVLQDFLAAHAEDADPTVRGIIEGGAKFTAVDAFRAQYKLEALRRITSAVWERVDFLLLPTTGTTYTIDAVNADPVKLNSNLGLYTNFVNLIDLAAVAVPVGLRRQPVPPIGVSVIGPAHTDRALLAIADTLHRGLGDTLGGMKTPLADTPPLPMPITPPGCTLLAVVGAHLTGQPLNHQLTSRKARLVSTTRTAAGYKLYALTETVPPKPGLVRAPGFAGPGIIVEVWAIPTESFGSFVAEIPAPLGIGSVELENGSVVKGFVCEPFAIDGAEDITHFGGWWAYRASKSNAYVGALQS